MDILSINGLSKSFGDKKVLVGVDLSVPEHSVFGFIGRNGAGKTTTMKSVLGLVRADSGEIRVCGEKVVYGQTPTNRYIGYLPDVPEFYPFMNAEEYLKLCGESLRMSGDEIKKKSGELLELVGLAGEKHRIKGFSRGMKQRLGIAQALIGSPEVIIFDEPTVGLDPKQIIEVRNLLRNLGRDHTVILSTHILQEVQAVCDRIIIINKGKIVADEKTENITRAVENNRRFTVKICGPQKEVLNHLRSKPGIVYAEALAQRDGDAYSYIIESDVGVDIRKSLFYTLAEKNWPLIGLEAMGMSLEDIFIAIVDQSANKNRYEKRSSRQKGKTSVEQEYAKAAIDNAGKKQGSQFSALFGEENDSSEQN